MTIKSNKAAQFLEDLFVNKGAMDRAKDRAIKTQYRKSGEMVMKNADDSKQALNNLRESRKWANEVGGSSNSDHMMNESMARRAHATKGFDKMSGDEMVEATKKASDEYASALTNNTTWEAAKGYFTEPYKAMGDESLTQAQRSLAQKQFAARTGAAVGATALSGGIVHDMYSSNEQDTGLGGIAVNTMGATGLSAGVAAGVGLLKKL